MGVEKQAEGKMAIKAIICLLAVSFAQGSIISNSLGGSLSSIIKDTSPMSSLSRMTQMRMVITDWDKVYDFKKLGLEIKLRYEDPNEFLKGVQVFVGFTVPTMLQPFTMGLTKIELDVTHVAPQILMGLFDMKIGYTIVKNGETIKGTVDLARKMEDGKHITKIVINGKDTIILDLSLDTDMKNKMLVSCSMGGQAYSLRMNRVRGSSLIVSPMVNGHEYTAVISPNLQARKISIHSTSGRAKTHEAEIVYNPISTEYGVYMSGNVFGPLDCRFILEKNLKSAQVIVSHNKINYAYVNMVGDIKMAAMLPLYFKYTITYDLLQGNLGEGVAKINYSGLDVEKLRSVSLAPKTGHSFDFTAKVKVEENYSFEIDHELKRGELIYYIASHKHTVTYNTADKWISLWVDKCHTPTDTPLYAMVHGKYFGDLLSNMNRNMVINIDWKTYKIDYSDTIKVNNVKHLAIMLNTKNTPGTFQLYYPEGLVVKGINFGFKHLLGKASVDAVITYDVKQKIIINTNIDNLKIILTLPNLAGPVVFSARITHAALNKEAFKFEIIKTEPLAFKVDMSSSFFTQEIPYLCAPVTSPATCHWSGVLNFKIDLAHKVATFIPAHSLYMGLTRDFNPLVEVQHTMEKFPCRLRVNCPLISAMPPIDITIAEAKNQLIIEAPGYIPGIVVIDMMGAVNHIKYGGYELATVVMDPKARRVAFSVGLIPAPIFEMTYAADALLKNTVTFDIVLPIVGKVIGVTADWMMKDLMDLTLKAAVVGNIPVVGDFTVNDELAYTVALPKGTITAKFMATFTRGLVAYIPPLDATVTVNYDIPAKMVEGSVKTTSGLTYGASVKDGGIHIIGYN